nr:MAG TPA: hypothetical protein [Caudoviricetes sp.]
MYEQYLYIQSTPFARILKYILQNDSLYDTMKMKRKYHCNCLHTEKSVASLKVELVQIT